MRIRQALTFLGTAIVMAAFIVGSFSLIQNIQHGNQDQEALCRVAKRSNDTLRKLFALALHNSRISLRGHPAQLAQSQRFYAQALSLLPPVDCKKL
jgi:hypothetical protein